MESTWTSVHEQRQRAGRGAFALAALGLLALVAVIGFVVMQRSAAASVPLHVEVVDETVTLPMPDGVTLTVGGRSVPVEPAHGRATVEFEDPWNGGHAFVEVGLGESVGFSIPEDGGTAGGARVVTVVVRDDTVGIGSDVRVRSGS